MSFADVAWRVVKDGNSQDDGGSTGSKFKVTKDLLPILKEVHTELIPPATEDSYFRISGIPDLCMREEILCAINCVTRKRKIPAVTKLVWAIGSLVHTVFQQEFLGPKAMLIGDWECVLCGLIYDAQTIPVMCPCWAEPGVANRAEELKFDDNGDPVSLFTFLEEHLVHEGLNIGGHPDGGLVVGLKEEGEEKPKLLELKSIRSDLFVRLHEPYEQNVEQSSLYAWLKGYDRIKLVYVNKNGSNPSNFLKEFEFDRDDDAVNAGINRVKLIRRGIRDRKLPKRTVCVTPKSARAKKCAVVKQCFRGWRE